MLPNVQMYGSDGATTPRDAEAGRSPAELFGSGKVQKKETDVFSKRSRSVFSRHVKTDSKISRHASEFFAKDPDAGKKPFAQLLLQGDNKSILSYISHVTQDQTVGS